MKVAAYQAPLLAAGSMGAIDLIRARVQACEALGVATPQPFFIEVLSPAYIGSGTPPSVNLSIALDATCPYSASRR